MPHTGRAFVASVLLIIPALLSCQTGTRDRPDPNGPEVACTRYGTQSESPYVLPYAVGAAFEVWGSTSHYNVGNGGVGLFAVDFVMPIGTPVVAARSGVVAAERDSFPDDNNVDLEENFVFVRHADGTVGRYFHLTRGGSKVSAGDSVQQGDVIGLSGNSGQSTGPHLHFDVQRCGPNLPPNYNAAPCGQTLPVVFRNTEPHACGVVVGRSYVARPLVNHR